jgi:hypothetical protein
MPYDVEEETPRQRLFHRITGWIVLAGGSFASYAAIAFLMTH